LLNIDYKILTKSTAKRLEKVLPKIINTNQTGYIKGRFIGENVRLIQDAMFHTKGLDALSKFLFILQKICHQFPETSAPGDF